MISGRYKEDMGSVFSIFLLIAAASIPAALIVGSEVYKQHTNADLVAKALEKGQDPIKAVCAVNLKDYQTACNELLE